MNIWNRIENIFLVKVQFSQFEHGDFRTNNHDQILLVWREHIARLTVVKLSLCCSPFFDDKWPIVSLGDPCSCGGVCSSTVLSVLSVLKKAQIDDRREMGTNWLSACHEKFTPHSWLSQGEQLAPKCHICSTHKNTISIFSRPKETKRDNSLESNLQSLFFLSNTAVL